MNESKGRRTIDIEIIDSSCPSVQCIHALRQVMEFFEISLGLSPLGNDRFSVIAWFNSRYPGKNQQ